MRFTEWRLHDWRWELNHRLGNLGRTIIWKLPHKWVYWAAIRVMIAGTDGNPADRSCGDALKYYGARYLGDGVGPR